MSSGPKYVTRVRMAPDGYRHEHIEEIEYHHAFDLGLYGGRERSNGPELQYAAVAVMVMLIEQHGWEVHITGAPDSVRLTAVHPYGRPPYLRGFADKVPTNDLLDLPRY